MASPRLAYYRDLVLVLLSKDFKVRYKSTALGYAWSVLNPLLFAGVFYLVFGVILGVDFRSQLTGVKVDRPQVLYPLFLVVGLFPWQWFQNSVTAANQFFLGNSTLIKKVRFPREFLALSGVLCDGMHFVLSVPVIGIFMLWAGASMSAHWLWQIPLLIVLHFALTQGVALIVATTNLFFRDLERLTTVALMLWFYLTPVIYPTQFLSERGLGWLLCVNPMAPLIVSWQKVFLEGVLPMDLLAASAGYAAAAWLVGHMLYRRFEWRFAEIV